MLYEIKYCLNPQNNYKMKIPDCELNFVSLMADSAAETRDFPQETENIFFSS